MTTLTVAKPWYREPWPWLLMLGPAIVVVAGFVTLYYAIVSFDGMVADDYYKRGLTVNQDLSRRQRAVDIGVVVQLSHDAPARNVVAVIRANAALPAMVSLRFTHPTRAGNDHPVTLKQVSSGRYEGTVLLPPLAKWNVLLDGDDWAVGGEWSDTATRPLELKAASQ